MMRTLYLALVIAIFAVPSFGATVFYVDPDWTGTQTGAAATPWTSLSSAWSTINSALSSGDVTVYFSARKASSDTEEVYSSSVDLNQKVASSRLLTLDGHSMYNSNASSPNWQTYTGNNRTRVPSFLSQNDVHVKKSNIVVDGFHIVRTTSGKAVAICGDNWTLRNSDISHTSGASDGPLVLIVPTSDSAHEGSSAWCPASSNITIENNAIHDSSGEVIYVGGGGCSSNDPAGGSPCMGFPSHHDVMIRNNKIYNGGVYGGQGDGIDIKGGLYNLTVSGNEIYNVGANTRAIVTQGMNSSGPTQNNVIERNYIHNNSGLDDAAIALVNSWGTPKGVEVRNNVIANNNNDGIRVYDGSGLRLYNNTIYKSGAEAIVVYSGGVSVINNLLVANNGGGAQVSLSGSITSNNNAYSGTWSGACTGCQTGASTEFVNASSNDFHLLSTAKSRDTGAILSSISLDITGLLRPQGTAYDVGAYEYSTTGATLNAPANLRVVP